MLLPEEEGDTPAIEHFILDIKKGNLQKTSTPTLSVAKKVTELLRNEIAHQGKATVDSLLKRVKIIGRRLAEESHPYSLVIDNITRRVLYMVREEYENALRESSGDPALVASPRIEHRGAPGGLHS
eukprot:RCo022554